MTNTQRSIAEQVLRLLDDGRRTGTHKLVLLLAIMDAVESEAEQRDAPPDVIPVRAVARPIMRILWQQVAPFVPPARGQPVDLRQMRPNGRGNPPFTELTRRARREAEQRGVADLDELARRDERLVRTLESGLIAAAVKNPIPRLQRVGGDRIDFLYRWPWPEDRLPCAVARAQGRTDDEPYLEFLPGASDDLLRLAPVLRPVVQSRLVTDVATYNNLHTDIEAVRDHLFGIERWRIPSRLREALRDLQEDRCGYCDGSLKRAQIDHFVPWAWRPNNAVENLVLADGRCNNSKRDRFAAREHVERWVAQLSGRSELGRRLGPEVQGVYTDPVRSLGIARRSYRQLEGQRGLWVDARSEPRPAAYAELKAIDVILRDVH